MNKILFLGFVIFLVGSRLWALEPKVYPDLSRAIQGGRLADKVDNEYYIGFQYEYFKAINFVQLKKDLGEFLGKTWVEKERQNDKDELLRKVMKAEGVELVEHAEYISDKFPEDYIIITLKTENINNKTKYILTIFGTWNNK